VALLLKGRFKALPHDGLIIQDKNVVLVVHGVYSFISAIVKTAQKRRKK
jgi:hypothetical protein